jgi:hypothetical protein
MRRWLSFSALVVGAMVPDILNFVQTPLERNFGHTVPGLFLFCLPAGITVLWLYHALLKEPLLGLLPESHRARLQPYIRPFYFFPAKRFLFILASLLVGAVTHIAWDSFTHRYGFFVQNFSVFEQVLFSLPGMKMPLFRLLQILGHGGFLVLIVMYWRWYKKAQPVILPSRQALRSSHRALFWFGILGAAFTSGLVAGCSAVPKGLNLSTLPFFAYDAVMAFMAVAAAVLLVYCLGWQLHRRISG